MSWRVTIVLWVAALACVAAAVAAWRQGPTAARVGELRPLLREHELPVERVRSVRIERPGQAPLVLERVEESGAWIELLPSGLPVDPFLVREAIEAARKLEVSRRIAAAEIESSEALARLGLAPAEATVTYGWDEGQLRLDLGRLGVAGRAFVQVREADQAGGSESRASAHRGAEAGLAFASSGVTVVGQELHDAILRRDPRQWRLRTLFPGAGAETDEIHFEAGENRLSVVRRDGRWWLEAPVRTRADRVAVEALLQAVARAECDGFLDDLDPTQEDRSAWGLTPPAATFTVVGRRTRSGRPSQTLEVGEATVVGGLDRYGSLAGHPVLMKLSGATLASLFVNPAALIDPTAVGVSPADVKQVRIEGPDGSFSLRRDLDGWRSVETDQEAAKGAVEELLNGLASTRAASVILQPMPEERVVGKILLYGFDGAALAEITVGADVTRSQWALDAGDGVPRIFPASSAPSLSPTRYGLMQPGL